MADGKIGPARRQELPAGVLLLLFVLLLSPMARAATQTLLLDVRINGHSIGKIGEFTQRDGVLLATSQELHELGIRGPSGLALQHANEQNAERGSLIALSDLPGLRWRVDQPTQTIYISATNDRLLPNILEGPAFARVRARRDSRVESGVGATLNYDVAATSTGRQVGESNALDLRIFSPQGTLSYGMLAYVGAGNASTNRTTSATRTVRLDTLYTVADVGAMRRYSLGDVITGGLSWTRPIRLTGMQFRSDFSLRPDLVTFPLPGFAAAAAVPSTVDVLANGNLVMSHQVDAGPFEIPQLPVVSGASTVSIVVTDAMGQQVSITRPFYASSSLLAPGLQTFSAQAGLVRREWGQISNDYGKIAALGDFRRGLTPKVTIEASGETTPGATLVGAGAVIGVGELGIVNASASVSSGPDGAGTRLSFGVQRIGSTLSFSAAEVISSPSFRDVAALNGDLIQRRALSVASGFALRQIGSLGVAYAETRQDPSPHPLGQQADTGQHGQVVSGSYSRQFHHLSLYLSVFKDLANGGSTSLRAGFTIPLSRRQSVEFSGGSGEGHGETRVQKSAAEIGQVGYDAYFSGGTSAHDFAQAQYKSSVALFTAGIDQEGWATTLRAEAQGAVSWIDRSVFASNSIYDSFAVVDTNGFANIHVLEDNRNVGVTNAKGLLLVPGLRAFELNHLAINANDVPLDGILDSAVRNVTPQDRSGIVVRFPVRVGHAALLRLVDDAGAPLAVGGKASLRSTNITYPIGFDGEAYVQDLSARNQVDAELPNGRRCTATFDYLPVTGSILTVGPLLCRSVPDAQASLPEAPR